MKNNTELKIEYFCCYDSKQIIKYIKSKQKKNIIY